jgi:rhamnose utilization protein RhaD (predicted bifunctional aldolase and dehydrogenase)
VNSSSLAGLRLLSALLGSDPLCVQGAGGNASLKEGATLWVKASGLRLAQAPERDIFLPIPLAEAREHAGAGGESLADLASGSSLLPSIETPLHVLLPQRVVLHLHLIDAIVHTLQPHGRENLAARLDGLRWVYVPYARPGLPLSLAVARALEQAPAPPEILVLENHGLVAAAETETAALALVREAARRLFLPERHRPLPDVFALRDANDQGWTLPPEPLIHALAFEPALSALWPNPVFYPDHAVFLGSNLPVAEEEEKLSGALARFRDCAERVPPYAVFPGKGVLLAPEISPGARAMLTALAHTALRLPEGVRPRGLSAEAVAELEHWDAEKWRRQLDASSLSSSGREL